MKGTATFSCKLTVPCVLVTWNSPIFELKPSVEYCACLCDREISFKDITSCVDGMIFNQGVWFHLAYDQEDEEISARGDGVENPKSEEQGVAGKQTNGPRQNSK